MSIGCPEVSQHSHHDVKLNQGSEITDLSVCVCAQAERMAAAQASPDSFVLPHRQHSEKPRVCRVEQKN